MAAEKEFVWETPGPGMGAPSSPPEKYAREVEYIQETDEQELRVAATVGMSLLERNAQNILDIEIKQEIINEQKKEIEFLKNKTSSFEELQQKHSDLVLRMELSVAELAQKYSSLRDTHMTLKEKYEKLWKENMEYETKAEQLQQANDELNKQLDTYRRENHCMFHSTPSADTSKVVRFGQFSPSTQNNQFQRYDEVYSIYCNSEEVGEEYVSSSMDQQSSAPNPEPEPDEEDNAVKQRCELLSTLLIEEQRRVIELEDQLKSMVTDNKSLKEQMENAKADEISLMKSICEEFTSIGENIPCSLPNGGVEYMALHDRALKDLSRQKELEADVSCEDMLAETSLDKPSARYNESVKNFQTNYFKSPFKTHMNTDNHRTSITLQIMGSPAVVDISTRKSENSGNSSLSQNLNMEIGTESDVNTNNSAEQLEFKRHGSNTNRLKSRCLSESQAAQTQRRSESFLCQLTDGDDFKVSIYGDGNPTNAKYKNYQNRNALFKKMLHVLKTVTKNSDNEEIQASLDDNTSIVALTLTPMKNNPSTPEDLGGKLPFSVNVSSVKLTLDTPTKDKYYGGHSTEQAKIVAVSERIAAAEQVIRGTSFSKSAEVPQTLETPNKVKVIVPYKGPSLEYISVTVNVFEGNDNACEGKRNPQKVRKRIKYRKIDQDDSCSSPPRLNASVNNRENNKQFDPSTASKDLKELRKLNETYAEILRKPLGRYISNC